MDSSLADIPSIVASQLILPFLLYHCEVYSAKPNRTIPRIYRRQKEAMVDDGGMEHFPEITGKVGPDGVQADEAAHRFSTYATKGKKGKTRTTPSAQNLEPHCDHIPVNCLHAHKTSKVCARTVYYNYQTMENYCMLEYVNCMEGYDIWQVVYMGECFNLTDIDEYINYPYHDDFFLDQYYVVNDH